MNARKPGVTMHPRIIDGSAGAARTAGSYAGMLLVNRFAPTPVPAMGRNINMVFLRLVGRATTLGYGKQLALAVRIAFARTGKTPVEKDAQHLLPASRCSYRLRSGPR